MAAGNGATRYSPPTVSDTKAKFLDAYDKPIQAIYTTIVQELLVTQHFMRYNVNYKYDEVRPRPARTGLAACGTASDRSAGAGVCAWRRERVQPDPGRPGR